MDRKAVSVGVIFIVLCILMPVSSVPTPNKADEAKPFCTGRMICRWAVYGKDLIKKKATVIMDAACACDPNKDCIYDNEENYSLGAYIYRCKSKPSEPTTTTPATTTEIEILTPDPEALSR